MKQMRTETQGKLKILFYGFYFSKTLYALDFIVYARTSSDTDFKFYLIVIGYFAYLYDLFRKISQKEKIL